MRAFFVALIFMFSPSGLAAESNPPAPTPPKAAGHQKAESRNPDHKGQPEQAVSQWPVAISPVPVNVTITQNQKTESGESAQNKDNHSSAEWWVAGATIALAAITGFLAWFTLKLWRSTRRLVKDAKTTAERQLRAYVSVTPNWTETFSATTPVRMRAEISNHGVTPAYRISNYAFVDILPFPLPPNFPFQKQIIDRDRTYALAHGQSMTLAVTADRTFTEQEISDVVENNGKRIYMYGVVAYTDASGEDRTTEFCRAIIGSDNLALVSKGGPAPKVHIDYEICQQHNDAT